MQYNLITFQILSHLHYITFQILSYLLREKRLLQPKDCPDSLYDMMLRGWEFDTENRLLKIQDIVQHLKELAPLNNNPTE